MRTCKHCGGTDFYSGGRCKPCHIKKVQARYFGPKHEDILRYHRERNNKSEREGRKAALRKWIKEYKSSHPCQDCNNYFPPECMDFDHRDPATKTRGIAMMIGGGQKLETIQAEIAKCDLVCANCHRIRTARQLEWW